MRRILLTAIILLLSTAVFAQKNYDIKEAEEIAKINHAPALVTSYKGRRVYYDYRSNQYLLEEHFAKKYGMPTVKALDQMYLKGKLFEAPIAEPSVKHTQPKLYIDEGIDYQGYKYKLKMNPRNLVAGTAVIGASAAAYMLTSSITSSRAKKLGEDLANGDISADDFAKKVESMDKTNRTVGYICAGTSLAGVIVVLTGLHKEYAQGVNLGHNFTVSDCGAGLSLTKKF